MTLRELIEKVGENRLDYDIECGGSGSGDYGDCWEPEIDDIIVDDDSKAIGL